MKNNFTTPVGRRERFVSLGGNKQKHARTRNDNKTFKKKFDRVFRRRRRLQHVRAGLQGHVGGAVALRGETVRAPLPVQHPVVQRQDGAGERAQLRARQAAQVRRAARVHVPDGPGRLQSGRQPAALRHGNRGRRQTPDVAQ